MACQSQSNGENMNTHEQERYARYINLAYQWLEEAKRSRFWDRTEEAASDLQHAATCRRKAMAIRNGE